MAKPFFRCLCLPFYDKALVGIHPQELLRNGGPSNHVLYGCSLPQLLPNDTRFEGTIFPKHPHASTSSHRKTPRLTAGIHWNAAGTERLATAKEPTWPFSHPPTSHGRALGPCLAPAVCAWCHGRSAGPGGQRRSSAEIVSHSHPLCPASRVPYNSRFRFCSS